MNNCQKCIFFEAKKKQDLYMWYVAVILVLSYISVMIHNFQNIVLSEFWPVFAPGCSTFLKKLADFSAFCIAFFGRPKSFSCDPAFNPGIVGWE